MSRFKTVSDAPHMGTSPLTAQGLLKARIDFEYSVQAGTVDELHLTQVNDQIVAAFFQDFENAIFQFPGIVRVETVFRQPGNDLAIMLFGQKFGLSI